MHPLVYEEDNATETYTEQEQSFMSTRDQYVNSTMSIFILWLSSIIIGSIFQFIRLPNLIGMLLRLVCDIISTFYALINYAFKFQQYFFFYEQKFEWHPLHIRKQNVFHFVIDNCSCCYYFERIFNKICVNLKLNHAKSS